MINVLLVDDHDLVRTGIRRLLEDAGGITVYAEATILGDITIGRGAVIGGNVWLSESIPAETVVTMTKPEALYKKKGPGFDDQLEYYL